MNEEVRKRALALLEKRDYSRKLLFDKLTEKGATPEEADEVADRMCELGLVDDRRYAELLVRHYTVKGYGERRLREELYRRGVPRELWDEALETAPEPDDTVFRLLSNRLRGSTQPEDLRRCENYLLRRGFGYADIRAAEERYLSENEDS